MVLVGGSQLQAQSDNEVKTVDKIVAVLGDNIILYSDVEAAFLQYQNQGVALANGRCSVLDNLILEKFYLAQANLDSVYVGDDEVESELEKRISYFINLFGSRDEFEKYYGKTTLEIKDDFREDIRSQLLADRMQSKVFEGLKVTPKEVKAFFSNIPDDSLPYFNAEVELAQIVMYPRVSEELKDYARQKMEKIRNDIVSKNTDFCTQAILYSDDPGSKSNCGDLGFVNRGEMVKPFEAAAFRLEEGQLSDIVETEYGFHIIECLERRGEKVHLRHILIAPQTTSYDEKAVETELDSLRNRIVRKELDFSRAVLDYSEDEQTKTGGGLIANPDNGTSFFEMNQLEGDLLYAVSNIELGEITRPVKFIDYRGKTAYRVLTLVSETSPHKANLQQDYSKIAQAARNAKQAEVLDKWINEHSATTYIHIDKQYANCTELAKWEHKN